jgi:ribosome maturation protein Sdo1
MKPVKTFDKERVSFNLAKLKREGANFEVAVDADLAIAYVKNGEKNIEDLKELVSSENIFFDVHKGELASEEKIKTVFGTEDFEKIANRILLEGEI